MGPGVLTLNRKLMRLPLKLSIWPPMWVLLPQTIVGRSMGVSREKAKGSQGLTTRFHPHPWSKQVTQPEDTQKVGKEQDAGDGVGSLEPTLCQDCAQCGYQKVNKGAPRLNIPLSCL